MQLGEKIAIGRVGWYNNSCQRRVSVAYVPHGSLWIFWFVYPEEDLLKSSLLLSLMNELEIVEGGVQLSGSVAYVPQESWILPTTVRENIVYGRGLDQDWYNRWYQLVVLILTWNSLWMEI